LRPANAEAAAALLFAGGLLDPRRRKLGEPLLEPEHVLHHPRHHQPQQADRERRILIERDLEPD
jgi:hypothetical protein